MNLTEAKLKQMIASIMSESKHRDEHIDAAFSAIEFYEEGFLDQDPSRNSTQALGGLANLISKGIVACIKQGPSYASPQMELINKAKEFGIFNEVAKSVIDLSKENVSPEIRLKEELLKEVAKGPQDLPEDVFVRVFHQGPNKNLITILFTDRDGNYIPPVAQSGEDNPIYGDVSFYLKSSAIGNLKCDDSAVIAATEVADGWGPMLYDIAMEIGTQRSNGLTPDRRSVSDEAQEVWDFYANKRPDVQQHQLDDEYNSLTPEEEDNCVQFMARDATSLSDWSSSPLSKRYTKEMTVLDQIRDQLIWEI